jgi:hypothetical protein
MNRRVKTNRNSGGRARKQKHYGVDDLGALSAREARPPIHLIRSPAKASRRMYNPARGSGRMVEAACGEELLISSPLVTWEPADTTCSRCSSWFQEQAAKKQHGDAKLPGHVVHLLKEEICDGPIFGPFMKAACGFSGKESTSNMTRDASAVTCFRCRRKIHPERTAWRG